MADDAENIGTHYVGDSCPGGHRDDRPSQPSMRVRAVMHDDAIFVHLRDLLAYVSYPLHNLTDDQRHAVASLLQRLGEALESE